MILVTNKFFLFWKSGIIFNIYVNKQIRLSFVHRKEEIILFPAKSCAKMIPLLIISQRNFHSKGKEKRCYFFISNLFPAPYSSRLADRISTLPSAPSYGTSFTFHENLSQRFPFPFLKCRHCSPLNNIWSDCSDR